MNSQRNVCFFPSYNSMAKRHLSNMRRDVPALETVNTLGSFLHRNKRLTYWFLRAAVTNYHTLGVFKQKTLSHRPEVWNQGADRCNYLRRLWGIPPQCGGSLACGCITVISASMVTKHPSLCVYTLLSEGHESWPHPNHSHLQRNVSPSEVTFWGSRGTWILGGPLFSLFQWW